MIQKFKPRICFKLSSKLGAKVGYGYGQFYGFRSRRIRFGIEFFGLGPRNMRYLCIELSLSGTNLLLQLKINYGG
jgi:hypothetical protein